MPQEPRTEIEQERDHWRAVVQMHDANLDRTVSEIRARVAAAEAADAGGSESDAQRRARREAVVRPILTAKGLSVYRWEKDAGVANKVGQRYLDGKTYPRIEQQKNLATVIGLEDLPL